MLPLFGRQNDRSLQAATNEQCYSFLSDTRIYPVWYLSFICCVTVDEWKD